jgi:hypothetical protein
MIPRHGLRLVSCTLFSSLLFSSLLLIPFDYARASGVLPDTGQTKCYNNTDEIPCPAPGEAFYGQDGNYQGAQPAYQVSADGLVVTDLNTGLMWQRADDGAVRDLAAVFAYCESLALGGYSDWRIPSIQELVSIVDYGRYDPAFNPAFGCRSSGYWSGSPDAHFPGNAWYVTFGSGYANGYYKTHSNYVRCVRGGPSGSSGSLDITGPDGGEVLVKGQNYTITWDSQNVTGPIQIDLYKGGSAAQQFLRQIAAAAPNNGSYSFISPNDIPNGSDYLIRISANSGSVQNFSRAFFTITDTPTNATRSVPWNLLLLLNE